MATEVYTSEDIVLQDGTELTLKPLPIRQLKKFMKQLGSLPATKTEEESIDQLVELAWTCLEKNKALVDRKIEDDLEDALDVPTLYKIIDVCGGVKLNDPKLMELAATMMEAETGKI